MGSRRVVSTMALVAALLAALCGCASDAQAEAPASSIAAVEAAVAEGNLGDAVQQTLDLKLDYQGDTAVDDLVESVAAACQVAAEAAEATGDLALAELHYSRVLELEPSGIDLAAVEEKRDWCSTTGAARRLLADAQSDPQYEDKIHYATRLLAEHPESEEAAEAVTIIADVMRAELEGIAGAIDHLRECARTQSDPAALETVSFVAGGDGLRNTASDLENSPHPDGQELAQVAGLLAQAADEGARFESASTYAELGTIADAASVPYEAALALMNELAP